jgi:dihydropteroate synthase
VPLPHRDPLVVGIVNATPDSFYDGGKYDPVAHAQALVDEGADWLDVGGESTRPGASPVSALEEWDRVAPVFEAMRGRVRLSIDTTKPEVAEHAAAAGATVLNDVRGLEEPAMVEVSRRFETTIVMHSRGTPETMGQLTDYADIVREVRDWLVERAARAQSPSVLIDPGIGFAKTAEQSLKLLQGTAVLVETGLDVLIGASRKSFIGRALGRPSPEDRLPGSLGAVAAAYHRGAMAFRVHDVRATKELLRMLQAIGRA